MAKQFANRAAIEADLATIYGAGNVGEAQLVEGRPYMIRSGGSWVESPGCPTRLYEVYPASVSNSETGIKVPQVRFIERKADGTCWYERRVPRAGTFMDDVLNYFKQFVPGTYLVPTVVVSQEYSGDDLEKSSALVAAIRQSDGSPRYAIVAYSGGSLGAQFITASQAEEYIKIVRGI